MDQINEQPRRLKKSASAFRTISEVATELKLPQHVLRFWETKFSQIKPMKRGGGRRYYRPEDVQLLSRIQGWLYDDGYTIKGVQKLLREGGPAEEPTVAVEPSEQISGVEESAAITDTNRDRIRGILNELKEIRALLG